MINPQTYEKTQEYIDLFVELRKSKGMTPEKAKEIIMSDYAYYGCLMIKTEMQTDWCPVPATPRPTH